ncbi:unnamed protein product, partial [marine sediment metagenome]
KIKPVTITVPDKPFRTRQETLSIADIKRINLDIKAKGYSEVRGITYTIRGGKLEAQKGTISESERKYLYGGILGADPSLVP